MRVCFHNKHLAVEWANPCALLLNGLDNIFGFVARHAKGHCDVRVIIIARRDESVQVKEAMLEGWYS